MRSNDIAVGIYRYYISSKYWEKSWSNKLSEMIFLIGS